MRRLVSSPPALPLVSALVAGLAVGCADDTAQPTGEPTSAATTSTSAASSTTEAPTSAPTSTSTGDATTTTGGEATMTSTGESSSTGADPGLCERLGGPAGAQSLAGGAVARVLQDERINAYFLNAGVDGGGLVTCLGDQVATLADCPGATYTCADMQAAHAGMKISALDFADFVADVALALDDHQLAEAPALTDDDKAALLAGLSALEAEIVEDPEGDASLYQRLGRKPAIRAVVGDPDAPSSWVARVAEDPALAGFFGGSDFVRLRTCLTRQLAAIEGPAVYGAEVDPPAPGVDPGVAADSPCGSMVGVHAGVKNPALGDAPITAADFVAMIGHLAAALEEEDIAQADAAALLSALEPLCPEIVVDGEACPGFSEEELYEAVDLNLAGLDGLYDGSLASMVCHGFQVPEDGIDLVAGVEVEVGIDAGYLGDLTIKLRTPEEVAVTLMSRPGHAEAADDGAGCSGDSTNLASTAPVLFKVGGEKDAELMGDGLNTDQVACEDDQACQYAPNPGAADPVDLAGLSGSPASGTWMVCVGDSCGGFTPMLQRVRLRLLQAKAPP